MVIGIGGISNSGKSALAKLLKVALLTDSTAIVCQDEFTIPKNRIPEIRGHTDWENPQSIDFANFQEAVLLAHKTNHYVIAEGLMAFYDKKLDACYDKRIFIELSHEEFFNRKQQDIRWGKEPHWYIDHIWESFLKYGQPQKNTQHMLFVDGEKSFDPDAIIDFLIK